MMQGTVYFMSTNIRDALTDKKTYLQSPLDDLESFFHVFVWAILHNEASQTSLSPSEKGYRDKLSGPVDSRIAVQRRLVERKSPSAIVSQLKGVIDMWLDSQTKLLKKWIGIELIYDYLVEKESIGQGGITEQAFWKWAWILIAFEGVQQILDIIYKHKEELVKYPKFIKA